MNPGAKVMDEQRASLKQCLRDDADACGIPKKALADRLGVPVSLLYAYLDEAQPTQHMPLRHLPAFIAAVAPERRTVTLLAAHGQCIVYPLPKGQVTDHAAAKALHEFGDVVEAHGAGLDGWTDEEIVRFVLEGEEAIAAIAAWITAVQMNHQRPRLAVAR